MKLQVLFSLIVVIGCAQAMERPTKQHKPISYTKLKIARKLLEIQDHNLEIDLEQAQACAREQELQAIEAFRAKYERQRELNQELLSRAGENQPEATTRIKELLVLGADPNTRNERGQGALHFASSAGNLERVRLLLDYHASAETKDPNMTLLHVAVKEQTEQGKENRAQIIELLIKAGAEKFPQSNYTPLWHAVVHGDLASCKAIVMTLSANNIKDGDQGIQREITEMRKHFAVKHFGKTLFEQAKAMGHDDIAKLVDPSFPTDKRTKEFQSHCHLPLGRLPVSFLPKVLNLFE